MGGPKSREKKFSEWGLPGEEIVGAPRETIFTLSRGQQRPYDAKLKKANAGNNNNIINLLISPYLSILCRLVMEGLNGKHTNC